MRLNLGSGFRKYEGFINVDSAPECSPDVVFDLEQTPWPWEDDSVEEIIMEHVLEHMGETTKSYLDIWKEIYRICQDGALVTITVPHWRHDYYFNDPTHVRPVTPAGIRLFDQESNLMALKEGYRATKLGLYTGIDIDLQDKDVIYGYDSDQSKGNEIVEVTMRVRIVKPMRGAAWLAAQKAA